ncbi:3-deoxy-7-phosphoheptulonate synthase class II [Sulfidibacter corallicola]|uniref:Phospho-2-dehydro-3-deoxyheptonate aldolase n=1 Tax=Sulfidibacter corallicola TaxID=2818388 RepID=A0A8A4TT09_SULCO|nr:3-deoxy-7-phosphoheptulonate synthase class II [Sulfidibacter corallicola]QTD52633.1 3-deoxy-7-phosphoheptulonate synthase class II [Sulfidibacter corallicola]
MQKDWHLDSWRDFAAAQQPEYPDPKEVEAVLAELRQQPPLVFAGECRKLKAKLARVAAGEAFLLQGGDCAEQFSQNHAKIIREKLRILLQMAVVLTYGSLKPVVKVGRIAGQYAKPRSSPTERIGGVEMASYKGDSVNSFEPTPQERMPDPNRLLRAYHQSASTLNLLRAFTHGGYADLNMVNAWNLQFVKNSPLGLDYEDLATEIHRTLKFIEACGIDSRRFPQLNQVDLYTSHEGLLLGYESALTRCDSLTGDWYNVGAHMVWIGDRTRQLDGAHVEYFRGINNPIGLKVGPTTDGPTLVELIKVLNPENEAGRLVLITRFGAAKIEELLPPLIRVVKDNGFQVVWCCDPMHGNTYKADTGHKTRHFSDILQELTLFFAIHRQEGTVPGGVHFELTGANVTECLGGAADLKEEHLAESYETACDPRLNAAQSLEMAFKIAHMLRQDES